MEKEEQELYSYNQTIYSHPTIIYKKITDFLQLLCRYGGVTDFSKIVFRETDVFLANIFYSKVGKRFCFVPDHIDFETQYKQPVTLIKLEQQSSLNLLNLVQNIENSDISFVNLSNEFTVTSTRESGVYEIILSNFSLHHLVKPNEQLDKTLN